MIFRTVFDHEGIVLHDVRMYVLNKNNVMQYDINGFVHCRLSCCWYNRAACDKFTLAWSVIFGEDRMYVHCTYVYFLARDTLAGVCTNSLKITIFISQI